MNQLLEVLDRKLSQVLTCSGRLGTVLVVTGAGVLVCPLTVTASNRPAMMEANVFMQDKVIHNEDGVNT